MSAQRRWSVILAAAIAIGAVTAAIFVRSGTKDARIAETAPPLTDAVSSFLPAEPEATEPDTTAVPASNTEDSEARDQSKPSGNGRIYGTVGLPAEALRGLPITVSVHRVDIESPVVVYAADPPVNVQADAAGKYEITGLPWGDYVVFGGAQGYTNNGSARLSEKEPNDSVNLTLVPGGDITGKVINETGNPVPGARVFNAGWNIGGQVRFAPRNRALASQSITDETGAFRIEHLRLSLGGEPGYRLAVKADGYATLLTDYIQAGTNGVLLTLLPGAVVAGQVVRRDTGAPIADRDVMLNSQLAVERNTARTDTEGFFFLSNVAPGTQTIDLIDNELVVTPETGRIEVNADGGPEDLVLLAAPGGRISGRVHEKVSGDGLGGITITCYERNDNVVPRKTVSRSDGTYAFTGLRTAAHRVYIQKPAGYASDHETENQEVAARVGEETADINFPLIRGLRITGQVLDTNNKPIEGVHVSAYDSKTGASDGNETTADGRFVLAGFAAGAEVQLHSSKEGLALRRIEPNGRQFTLGDKDVSGINFIFGSGGVISGTVVDTNGVPQPGIEMYASPQGPERLNGANATSGPDGAISFGPLSPGEYKVLREDRGRFISFNDTGGTINLAEGANVTGQRFTVPAKGTMTITGRVTDRGGRPVGGAGIMWNAGESVLARSDANGQFTLHDLHDRAYSLAATAPGYTPSEPVGAWAGDTNVIFVLDGVATISGRVLNAQTSAPITDFSIRYRNVRPHQFGFSGYGFTKVVDLEGRFELTNVQHGTGTVEVAADGFGSVAAQIPTVSAGENRRDVVIRLNAGAELIVRTLDSAGTPVPGAQVTVSSESMPSTQSDYQNNHTADDGTFRFDSLPAGPINVFAEHKEFPAKRVTATVAAGTTTTVDLVFSSGGSVEGLITLNGRPVANQHVSVHTQQGQGKSAETDADGRYRINGLAPGRLSMNPTINQVEGVPFQGKTANVTIADGAVTEANFDFTFGTGAIEGTIYTRPGAPLPDRAHLFVNVYGPSGDRNYFSTETDANGRYRVENMTPGQVSIQVTSESYGGKRVLLELADGAHVRRDIVLSGGTTLFVQLANPPALEQGWASIWVMPGDVVVTTLSLDNVNDFADRLAASSGFTNGQARIDRLEPGRYTLLTIFHPRRTTIDDDRDPYADAVWSVQTIDLAGEGEIVIQVSV